MAHQNGCKPPFLKCWLKNMGTSTCLAVLPPFVLYSDPAKWIPQSERPAGLVRGAFERLAEGQAFLRDRRAQLFVAFLDPLALVGEMERRQDRQAQRIIGLGLFRNRAHGGVHGLGQPARVGLPGLGAQLIGAVVNLNANSLRWLGHGVSPPAQVRPTVLLRPPRGSQ